MLRRPPRSTRTDTLFPYTTLFRSGYECAWHVAVGRAHGQLSIPAGQGRGVPRGLLGRAQGDGLARRQSPAVILNESRSIRRVRAPSCQAGPGPTSRGRERRAVSAPDRIRLGPIAPPLCLPAIPALLIQGASARWQIGRAHV